MRISYIDRNSYKATRLDKMMMLTRVLPGASYSQIRATLGAGWFRVNPSLVLRLEDGRLQLSGASDKIARYYDRVRKTYVDYNVYNGRLCAPSE